MRLKAVAILLIVLLVLVLLNDLFRPGPFQIHDTSQLKKLRTTNDSLRQSNQHLQEEIAALQLEATQLARKIRHTQQKRQQLQIEKDEKIQAIDHFDHDELFQFFARIKTDRAKIQ